MLRDRAGIALLLTLFVVAFMTAITMQMIASVNRRLLASYNQSDGARLDGMVQSGLALARAALYADDLENDFDSPHDAWAKLDPAVLSALFGDSRLEVKVVDLSGRLPVNNLVSTNTNTDTDADNQAGAEEKQREIWKRFLTSGRFVIESESEAEEVLDALADWLDSDDDERANGAEKNYYLSREPSYVCANAPFIYPEQLLLVKGVTRELLYGDGEHEGIIDYITVAGQGDGLININSAPAPVLQALSVDLSEDLVEEMIAFRENEENRELLASVDWYKQVSGFTGDIALDSNLLDVSGHYFQISVNAVYNELGKSGAGVVERRENNEHTLLYWKIE